jgi:hypothetical protein
MMRIHLVSAHKEAHDGWLPGLCRVPCRVLLTLLPAPCGVPGAFAVCIVAARQTAVGSLAYWRHVDDRLQR